MRNVFGSNINAASSRGIHGLTISNREETTGWGNKIEKLTIGSLDDVDLTVQAQYNPKELQIDKQIPWLAHDRWPANRRPANRWLADERPHESEQDPLEINSGPTRSMTIELLFDGYEDRRSIRPDVAKLEALSSIRKADSRKAALQRPHHCIVTWGVEGVDPFRCVIESLSTKFTMFAPNGAVLRAICTVRLKEVQVMSRLQEQDDASGEVLRPLTWRR